MDHQQLRRLIFRSAEADTHYHFSKPGIWSEVTAMLAENEEETIRFLKNDFCAETLFWIAPLLKEVNRVFLSAEFIKFLRWYLEEVMDYPYCQENFLTPFMRDYVSQREFFETVSAAIDEAEAVLSE